MTELKLGVNLSRNDPDVGDFAELVESLGFQSVWASEHISNYRPTLTVVPVLGAYAARTRHIMIGSHVLLLPLRNPVVIAKELSVLDFISRGRLAVGVGIGGENPAEFAACGVPVNERGRRANEALQILPRLWRERSVTFHGQYFTLDDVSLDPAPARPGGPPIYIAGRREAAIKRAALYGDGFMPYLYSPEQLAKAVKQIHAFAAANGRDLKQFEVIACVFITVSDTRDKATRAAVQFLNRVHAMDYSQLVDKFCVLGTPQDCVARLHEYVAAGANHVIFTVTAPEEEVYTQIRAIAAEILPAFRPTAVSTS